MKQIDFDMAVLIVDDSLAMRKVIRRYLVNHGFTRLLEVGDGRAALDMIRVRPVDLVISDLNMPVMTGMALLETLKSNPATRQIPFIMLTEEAVQTTMNRAIDLDVDSYIVKPVGEKIFVNEMIRVIRSAGDNAVTLL